MDLKASVVPVSKKKGGGRQLQYGKLHNNQLTYGQIRKKLRQIHAYRRSENSLLPIAKTTEESFTGCTPGAQQQYLNNWVLGLHSRPCKQETMKTSCAGTPLKVRAVVSPTHSAHYCTQTGEVCCWTTPALWASIFCQQQSEIYSRWWSLNKNGRIKGLKKSLLVQIKLTAAKLGFESKLYYWLFFLPQTGQCLFTSAAKSSLTGSCSTSTLRAP